MAIVGLPNYGSILLDKFKWGHGFYTLNSAFLEKYAKCDSAQALLECDKRFRSGEDNPVDDYMPNRDMPPSESSEDDDDDEEKNVDLHVENLSLKTASGQ